MGFDVTYTGNLKVHRGITPRCYSAVKIASSVRKPPAQPPTAFIHTLAQIVNNTEAGEVYVLYQCGTEPPANSSIPEGAKVFSIPLTSVVVPDTTAYAFLVR